MKRKSLAALLGGSTLIAACFTLDVVAIQPVSGTNYTRDSVLSDPGLMELAIASSFIAFWSGVNCEHPNVTLGVLGEELTSSATNLSTPLWDIVQEPRGSFDNAPDNNTRLARDPWGFWYEGNSAAAELGGHIKRNNIRVIDPVTGTDNTIRLLAFARWQMGMAHVALGVLFDSAAIVNEDVDFRTPQVLPLRRYQEVLDSGIKWLEESIVMSTENNFVLPLNENIWIYDTGVSSGELAAVAHSYIARAIVHAARSPSDPVNWARVKFHAERGITKPFGPRGNSINSFINFEYRSATTSAPSNTTAICNGFCARAGRVRVDTRIVGPSDTLGNYQLWLAKVAQPGFDTVGPIVVSTPDQRIQPEGGTEPSLSAPVYFKHTNVWPPQSEMDTLLRGKYYVSWYWNSTRARDNRTQFPATGGGRNRESASELLFIQDDMMVPAEMDLLIAEAEIHLGNLDETVRLINKTRVENGELPPVTTTGVPQSSDCVPRTYSGACGSLMDALMYEKRIETYGTGISFYDARRWGCLLEGTWTQLPVPGHQLLVMGRGPYTFGGNPGAVGSALRPTNCPLLHHP